MNKSDHYTAALREIEIRLEKGGNLIADLGNVTAVLKKRLAHYYWVGIYFLDKDRLVLGPFQGTPACVFLNLQQGVCAMCVHEKKTILVPDVHRFEGHVACDPNSQSEMVVPLFDQNGRLHAILDVDSTERDAFDKIDQEHLERIAEKVNYLF